MDAWEAEAVFVGTVTSISSRTPVDIMDFAGSRHVAPRVIKDFRSNVGDSVIVATGSGGGDCGYPFRVGETHLVYAHRTDRGVLFTGICGRSKPVGQAAEDLAYLRGIRNDPSTLARVTGRIGIFSTDAATGQSRFDPAPPGVVLVLSSPWGSVTATADEFGRVDTAVAPGIYSLAVDMPSWLYANASPEELILREPRSCGIVDVGVHDNGCITGRVMDADGMPVPGLRVQAAPTKWLAQSVASPASAVTDGDGRFEIDRLSAGEHMVGTSLSPSTAPVDLRPRVAARIVVARGSESTLPDLHLPGHIIVAPFTGIVLDADGKPAAGATVFIAAADARMYASDASVNTDETGRFTLAAVLGARYRLHAGRTNYERMPNGRQRPIGEGAATEVRTAGFDQGVLTFRLGRGEHE